MLIMRLPASYTSVSQYNVYDKEKVNLSELIMYYAPACILKNVLQQFLKGINTLRTDSSQTISLLIKKRAFPHYYKNIKNSILTIIKTKHS